MDPAGRQKLADMGIGQMIAHLLAFANRAGDAPVAEDSQGMARGRLTQSHDLAQLMDAQGCPGQSSDQAEAGGIGEDLKKPRGPLMVFRGSQALTDLLDTDLVEGAWRVKICWDRGYGLIGHRGGLINR
jgi:hypothetical protein